MAAVVTGLLGERIKDAVLPVVVADFMNRRGIEATPVIHSKPGEKAAAVMERFAMLTPETVSSLEGRTVIFVGNPEAENAPDGLENTDFLLAVTRERVSKNVPEKSCSLLGINGNENFPGASDSAMLKALYDINSMELSRQVAGGLLCVLIEELGNSGRPEQDDLETAEVLAQIAGVSDVSALAGELGFNLPAR